MDIIEKKLTELTPYANNPRHNDGAVDAVAASIREFGFKVPLVIDSTGTVVAGHTRLKTAKRLKMKTVPCVVADDLTDEQLKAFRLADNKVGELAEWDVGALDIELGDISLDMTQFGFDIDVPDDDTKESEIALHEKYMLVIDCTDENDMESKYAQLQELGIECRVSTL